MHLHGTAGKLYAKLISMEVKNLIEKEIFFDLYPTWFEHIFTWDTLFDRIDENVDTD